MKQSESARVIRQRVVERQRTSALRRRRSRAYDLDRQKTARFQRHRGQREAGGLPLVPGQPSLVLASRDPRIVRRRGPACWLLTGATERRCMMIRRGPAAEPGQDSREMSDHRVRAAARLPPSLGVAFMRKLFSLAVRWGLLGLVSGLLSCAMSQSYIIYVVREQKTYDHIVWPGLVFALVVLLPISRAARDGWLRTAGALIASSVVYPVAWRIAASGTFHPGPFMVAEFAFSGFLGSFVLAGVLLFGRPRWVRAACATIVLGTVVGGLMGAHLLAAAKGMELLGTARDGLGIFMVLWQTVVGASLGRAVLAGSRPPSEAARKPAVAAS
jgi:hypothetical protein